MSIHLRTRAQKTAALAALTLALSLPAGGGLAASAFEAHYTTASLTSQEQIAENLGQVNIAVFVRRHADADFGIAFAQNVVPVTGRGDQRGLRFFDRRVMRDILPGGGIGIAYFREHAAHVAVCRGQMREILIVAHIFRFEARDAAQRRINRQFGQIII